MNGDDVASIVRLLAENGIEIWLDGGWAVDALVGRQTRDHDDLDIVVRESDLPHLLEVLETKGFRRLEGGRPFNFLIADALGRQVDVHAIVFDAQGTGLYGPRSAGSGKQEIYRAGALTGQGVVAGQSVRCVSPEALIEYYTGYPISSTDVHDVQLLHERFGLELPEEYWARPQIRPVAPTDVDLLRDMAFYAARWRPGQENDSKDAALSDDHVARYVDGWGRPGDLGSIAEERRRPVGAAWLRLFPSERPGYGFIDPTIPELSIAVVPDRRGSGIGLALLTATVAAARKAGHSAVSLSVEVDNPARRLYKRVGFKDVRQVEGSWIMRLDLAHR